MGFWDEEKRVPIKVSVKKRVYTRAKGKCECCGLPLEMNHGDFHHTRDPTVSATSKTVQFLCPTCHRKYGHKRVTRTESDFWETRKVSKLVRTKAPKLTKNKTSTRKKTVRKKTNSKTRTTKRKAPERSRTKSGRFRKKRSDAGKKRK